MENEGFNIWVWEGNVILSYKSKILVIFSISLLDASTLMFLKS